MTAEHLPKFTLILRLSIVTFSILTIILFGSSIATVHSYEFYSPFGTLGSLAALALTAIWSGVFTGLQRWRVRAIHPGWPVAIDLLLCLILIVWTGISLAITQNEDKVYHDPHLNLSACCVGHVEPTPGFNCDPSCLDRIYGEVRNDIRILYAAGTFMAVIAALELAVFIRACIECQRHNKAKRIRAKHDANVKLAERSNNNDRPAASSDGKQSPVDEHEV